MRKTKRKYTRIFFEKSGKNILHKKDNKKFCPNCGDNNIIHIHSSFYSCPNCNYEFDSIAEKFDGIPNILLDKLEGYEDSGGKY